MYVWFENRYIDDYLSKYLTKDKVYIHIFRGQMYCNNLIYVELPENNSGYLEIINPLGEVVQKFKTQNNRNSIEIEVANLSSGTYYIKFYNAKESIIYRSSFMVTN